MAQGCFELGDAEPADDADVGSATDDPADGTGGFGNANAGNDPMTGGGTGVSTGGFPAGGVMMPAQCFECGPGCFDCGFGCGCDSFDPATFQWTPPFTNSGEPGWRDSEEWLCPGFEYGFSAGLWSDASGVYLAASGIGFSDLPIEAGGVTGFDDGEDAGVDEPAVGLPEFGGDFGERSRVWHNDGSGWKVRMDVRAAAGGMGVVASDANGTFVFDARPLGAEFGTQVGLAEQCPLGRLGENGALQCPDVDAVSDMAVADDSSLYALSGGQRVLRWEGEQWVAVGGPLPAFATGLWADSTNLIAVGGGGTLMRWADEQWVVEDPGGVLEGLTAVWGTSGDDLWVGTSRGKLLHFDGESWSTRAEMGGPSCGSKPAVRGIWGDGDAVYAHTDYELVRWDGSELESLGNWTCSANFPKPVITAMHGRSADELFIVVIEETGDSSCGFIFPVYFDGQVFHRF